MEKKGFCLDFLILPQLNILPQFSEWFAHLVLRNTQKLMAPCCSSWGVQQHNAFVSWVEIWDFHLCSEAPYLCSVKQAKANICYQKQREPNISSTHFICIRKNPHIKYTIQYFFPSLYHFMCNSLFYNEVKK